MSYNPQNPNGQATSANSSPVVIASDQSAVPVSGTVGITANSSVNVNQVGGTAIDLNSGVKSAGTQRVVIATDQPQLTNALKVDGSATTQPVSGTITVQQTTAANLKVDLSGTAANATAIKVDGSATTQPVSGTITANAGTGTFGVNNSQVGGNTISTGNGVSGTGVQRVTIASDSTGQVTLAAGSNTVGSVNILPNTTGGWSVNSQTALTSTKVAVKASAGTFGGYMIYNPNASVTYIQVFDVASGSVTLGSTTPTYVIPIPAGAAANVEFTLGINHVTAITLAATTTATGSSAPSSSLTGFFLYK